MWVKVEVRRPERAVGKWTADLKIDKKLLDKLQKLLQSGERNHDKKEG